MRTLAVVLVVVLGLAGCGKDPATAPSGAELEKMKQHTACMRSAGVDVPEVDEIDDAGGYTLNTKDPKTLAAMSACARVAPAGHREGDPDPEVEEHALKLAECLRKHGIRALDPEAGGSPVVQLEDGAVYTQQQLVDAYTVCGREVPQ